MKECVKETGTASEDMKCEDDVEYGDERREHVDIMKEDEDVDLDIRP